MIDTSKVGGRSFLVPAGERVYEGLRSAFVKMDALLEYLAEEKFNGYVLLRGEEGADEGLLLLQEGMVVAASYSDSHGKEAQAMIGERVAYSVGKMDIISLASETVEALRGNFGQQAPYAEFRTFFVDLDKLVTYLSGVGFSGSLSVTGKEGRGVVLLNEGKLVGAFTDAKPDMEAHLDAIKVIGSDGEGVITVSSLVR